MPTIKGIPGPYRFYFYSFDCNEPVHVHAEREAAQCKFRLTPLMLASNHGFAPRELNRVRQLVAEHHVRIRRAWDEHCSPR
jgi:hypothetical protein